MLSSVVTFKSRLNQKKREKYFWRSNYLHSKLTLDTLFLSFGIQSDDPFGHVVIIWGEGRPGIKTILLEHSICLKGVSQGWMEQRQRYSSPEDKKTSSLQSLLLLLHYYLKYLCTKHICIF